MASVSTCCILLVYGIPGSGKSVLTEHLCSETVTWSMFPIHFDSFYPPDIRATPELEDSNRVPFKMKQTRLEVTDCIERFIEVSILQSQSTVAAPALWGSFQSYLQAHRHHLHWHISNMPYLPSPCVLVIDDNLHLRSMRYPFYYLAKKYEFGFAEVCVCCDSAMAQARNTERRFPIPHSTILAMEQSLELPEPAKHHWEQHNCVVINSRSERGFLMEALARARELICEALANPEQMTPDQSETAELCRQGTLESYLHQADIVLRKCVSSSIQEYKGGGKESHAKMANSARKEVLEEIRSNASLVEHCRVAQISATSREYERELYQLFHAKLDSKFH